MFIIIFLSYNFGCISVMSADTETICACRDCVISVAQMPYDGHVPAHQRTSGPAVCELSSSSSSLTSTKRGIGYLLIDQSPSFA